MLRRNSAGVSHDTSNPVEAGAHELRERLKKTWQCLWRRSPSSVGEDPEDAVQGHLTRLVEEAARRGVDLMTLVRDDPAVIQQKLEAERSHRRRVKRALHLSREMAEQLPAASVLSADESAEVIEKLVEAANLNRKEADCIRLSIAVGRDNTTLLAQLLEVSKDDVYRLAHTARKKLSILPDIAKLLLEKHDHLASPARKDGGSQRKVSGYVLQGRPRTPGAIRTRRVRGRS